MITRKQSASSAICVSWAANPAGFLPRSVGTSFSPSWVWGGVGCVDDGGPGHTGSIVHLCFIYSPIFPASILKSLIAGLTNIYITLIAREGKSANLLDIPLLGLATDSVSGCNLLDIISSWLPGRDWLQTSAVTPKRMLNILTGQIRSQSFPPVSRECCGVVLSVN